VYPTDMVVARAPPIIAIDQSVFLMVKSTGGIKKKRKSEKAT
jgi:hypothetical protein